MKDVEGTFYLKLTTDNELPKARQMTNDIQEMFARVLDSYLHSKNVEGEEVHFILCDELTINEVVDD
jgi:hypothetical protein